MCAAIAEPETSVNVIISISLRISGVTWVRWHRQMIESK